MNTKIDASQVLQNLKIVSDNTLNKAENVMDYTMNDAESSAKRSAPWTDRTGNARRSINSRTWKDSDVIIGGLGIGVEYGKYLELCNQGRYRIVRPTIDIAKVKLMSNLRDIL